MYVILIHAPHVYAYLLIQIFRCTANMIIFTNLHNYICRPRMRMLHIFGCFIHVYICMCVNICIYVHMYMYKYKHIHIYVYIYVCLYVYL